MSQTLKVSETAGHDVGQKRRAHLRVVRNELSVEESDGFWLEASKGLWSNQPIPINPENSPGRVLTEMAMVLGGAALLALLSVTFFGMPHV